MTTIKRAAVAAPAAPDSSHEGPWPDNWKVSVKTCAARPGGTVYAQAEVTWDGPAFRYRPRGGRA
ncbi:hypothetical protein ACFYYS_28525 [Streptomyces sp. NPDC002120]|uniref:hypothetical protein n=1 Tax=Streptomyces sp. NPDC002120 TaxID=3364631 RepID=UPI0036BE873B